MNLIRKISPKGIDVNIDRIQEHLAIDFSSWTNFTCYPRIYKEDTESGVKPMNYVGEGEYVDVFTNDNIDGSCFFYEEDTRNATDNGYFNSTKLSIVFQVKLDKFYLNVLHRADEEIHNDIIISLKKVTPNKVTGIVNRIENVYSEFDTSQVQFDDIGGFHVFRIDMNIIVDNDCN